ncbi:hypothetical protein PENCOP_c002G02705 [Penicillium coprophilum]|uniref:Uncharacterized protein n=1 Tax=Penicillium coprophilum TaxID=36646 RepID=A0A1V6V2V9_9EURO|nr:hypothetical protein PENCOP_c002G02705 [Penicillium coprophilum]
MPVQITVALPTRTLLCFTLLDKTPGISVDQIYATLSGEVETQMVHQLTDYLIELYAQPWRESYTAYTNGCLERYVHAIEIHPSLESYRDLIPRIREFIAQLLRQQDK